MQSNGLAGRHAAVIGGSSGIGLAAAQLLAARGARVTIGGSDAGRLDQARAALPDGTEALEVDATDLPSLRGFYERAGPIDELVVTVTGRGGAGPASTLADHDLLGAFEGKTVAHLRALSLALPTLADDGSVTLVTAGSAQSALPGTAGLAAVNGALEAAIPPLARELGPRRVNAVSPGRDRDRLVGPGARARPPHNLGDVRRTRAAQAKRDARGRRTSDRRARRERVRDRRRAVMRWRPAAHLRRRRPCQATVVGVDKR
jgi:NAD(P)-dependent dehydrogenase (short-subunit alcohol dehydrogenase family)